MIKGDYRIKYQACCLTDALHRNINDNFENISFDIEVNGDIQVKIILNNLTEVEKEYINDISVEFSSFQSEDIVRQFIITTKDGMDIKPLKNVIYKKK